MYMRDVAHVRDGFSPQTNIVRQDGQRGTLLSVMKNGGASTLQIVAQIQRDAAADRKDAADGPDDYAAVRSVAVRAGVDQWRGARSDHRRLA